MLTTATNILNTGLTCLAVGFLAQATYAECPCEQGARPMPPAYPNVGRMPRRTAQPLTAQVPPGTLGRTYDLPSREIPADKHPRIGMIDVLVRNAETVAVYNINPHREEDEIDGFQAAGNNALWQFETKPLMPGVPHIYKVVFTFDDDDNARETVRYVRLIPGRIVTLVY